LADAHIFRKRHVRMNTRASAYATARSDDRTRTDTGSLSDGRMLADHNEGTNRRAIRDVRGRRYYGGGMNSRREGARGMQYGCDLRIGQVRVAADKGRYGAGIHVFGTHEHGSGPRFRKFVPVRGICEEA